MKTQWSKMEILTNIVFVLLVLVVAVPQPSQAAVVITSGMVSAGADFGCGQNGQPPTSFTLNGFYNEADLTTKPSGSFSEEGWATGSWNVSSGRIIAGGSSTAGFNGTTCKLPEGGTGGFYARGHAQFTVTITLDRDYLYNGTVSGDVSGISNGSGTLGPGTYTISGLAFGTAGAFSLNVTLSPAPLQITTTSVPSVATGQAYSVTLAASGGSGTGYTWSLASGSLPAGFTLSSAGVLSSTGSPAAEENSYNFTVQVTDSASDIATQPLTLAIYCPVNVFLSFSGQYMQATFIAPNSMTLVDYAAACGFVSFNWQQQITTLPGPSPFYPNVPTLIAPQNIASDHSLIATPSFPLYDPPPGSYTYLASSYDPFPFYYPSDALTPGGSCTMSGGGPLGNCPPFPDAVSGDGTTLSMVDDPADPDLPGTPASANPPVSIGFSSSLVGVDSQGNAHTLYSWTWNSTFNGQAGGASQTASIYPIDPGSGTGGVTLTSINGLPVPTVTVTPSSSSVTTAQTLAVTVAVSGGTGNPTPTGSIILTSGLYTSAATTLSSGSATINVAAAALGTGLDTLMVNYTPDTASSSIYTSASGSATVTVTAPAMTTPTVMVTPSSSSITTAQALNVTVTVNGGRGNPTPTGTLALTVAGYTSAATTLSGGAAINVPPGSLATGTYTLTVNYTPDTASSLIYTSASASTSVMVTTPAEPIVSLTSTSLTFGSQQVGTPSTPQAVTLSNVGNATLSVSSILASGDFSQTNTCSSAVAPGGNCVINLTFTPTALGARSGALTIMDNAGNGTQSFSLLGYGGPQITINNGLVNFGAVNVGANSTQTVVLSINTPLTLASVQASGDYSVQSDSCALNTLLPTNTLCTLEVQFAPTQPGQRWFPLVVTDSGSNIYSFGFEGTGVGSALAFTPGIISTVAGTGTGGYNGDNISATSAELYLPTCVAVDSAGNLYITDNYNHRIRKVDASGTITTVAGNGTAGYNGDNIPATSAELSGSTGVAVDSAGNLYFGDTYNARVRKVDASGTITTVAGNGVFGYNGDNIPATSAELWGNFGVAVDSAGNLYIADQANQRIRKVDASGIITTVAGNGVYGFSGDYGAATNAELGNPYGVAVDSAGNLYIAEFSNQVIRKVDTSGIITIVAGTGTPGYNGDNISATSAELQYPLGVEVDSAGNPYIVDFYNNRIRKVDASGIITTVAGTGAAGYNGDNIAATRAEINYSYGVAVDSAGNLYIADSSNQRIRKVDVTTSALSFGSLSVGQTSAAQSVAVSDVGTAPLNFSSLLPSSNFLLQEVGNDCVTGTPLAVGATCAVGVAFAPTLPGNPLTGAVTVSDNAFNTPQSVRLSGTASGAAVASLSAPSLSFGNQLLSTTSAALTETVTNTGTANLTISSPVTIGGTNLGDFTKSADTCSGATLTPAPGPGSTCTVSVTFTPLATGSRGALLTFTDNNNGVAGSTQTVTLSGTGTAPVAGVSPPSLTFGNEDLGTTSGSQAITLSNTGNAALTISGIAASANFGETNNCGGNLAAGGSCTINVTFSPTAASALTGTLTITDNSNGVNGSQQTVSLSGVGIGRPSVAILNTSQSLSGSTLTLTITVTNNGTGNGQNLLVNQVVLTRLGGSGTPTLTSPALPLSIGNWPLGANAPITLTLNVPSKVTKLSVTLDGTIQDVVGDTLSYSIGSVVFP